MSIEAMKQVIELYDTHCYNNDYGGIEFNKKHGYKFIEAIEALRTAIQQAEARTDEPVAWIRRHPNGALSNELLTHVQVEQVRRDSGAWVPLYTHPAPSVPDDVVLKAKRYEWLKARNNTAQIGVGRWESDDHFTWLCDLDADEAIDAAMLTAAQAQKGQQ